VTHTVAVECEECEGSGQHRWWGVEVNGCESSYLDPTRPCRYCNGEGHLLIPTEPQELEDLTFLLPKGD
jgi:DnaJ-class molecular chaperone